MSDTYTSSLRLDQPTVGGDSNTWGGTLNTDLQLIDSAITGVAVISLTGLSTYTLTANNGATDQSRCMLYQFTGAPTNNTCTVTIPASVKLGYIQNLCSNSTHAVSVTIVASGSSGTTLTVPNALGAAPAFIASNTSCNPFTFFYCDGTNVTAPAPGGTQQITTFGTIVAAQISVEQISPYSVYGQISATNISIAGNSSVGPVLQVTNLPTTNSGLLTGQVWRNGTTLMIV